MKEKTSILNNMSSSSRSSVNVRPRHVDPPTLGAKIRSDVGVLISLPEAMGQSLFDPAKIDEAEFLSEMTKKLIPGSKSMKPKECEERLREFANSVIEKYKLVGCITLSLKKSSKKVEPLKNLELVFAILSKSSESIFVASKTPNLSTQLFERMPITYDPRIIAILEAEK